MLLLQTTLRIAPLFLHRRERILVRFGYIPQLQSELLTALHQKASSADSKSHFGSNVEGMKNKSKLAIRKACAILNPMKLWK